MMSSEELKQRIVSIFEPFQPKKVILFGSEARGDLDEMSDLDLIVVYETEKPFLSRLKELYLNWDIPRAVDILAYTPMEFETMLNESFFLQDVLKESEVIYEAG
jgi:predicted nucleotidyltransferase